MAVDTSIYNHLLRPPKSVAEYDAEAVQGQQNRLMLQMERAKMDALQRSIQQENQLADVYRQSVGADGATDRNKLYSGAAAAGLGAKLPGIQKSYADLDESAAKTAKEQRLAEKAQFEKVRDEIGFINQIISSAKDQASYSQGRQAMAARGMDVSQIPEQYDPAYVANAGQQTMTELQRIEQMWKEMGFDQEERKFGETKRHNKAQEWMTVRGQNMTDKRERDSLSAGGRPPTGYRWKQDGTLESIPGGPADKQVVASEGERNAAGYADRMVASEELIGTVSKADAGAQKPGFVEQAAGGKGMIANATRSATRQQYRQAQEDWVRAKLRKESGAAIPNDEMDREISVYFPQIGDKPEVISQKANARKVATEAMKKAGGRAASSEQSDGGLPSGAFADADKERRYQEWKAKQGAK